MKKSLGLTLAMALMILAGCSGLPHKEPFQVGPVTPQECEEITVDNVVIMVDASGSMRNPEKFPNEKALVESFVKVMPTGNYNVSMIKFARSGTWDVYPMQQFNRGTLAEQANMLRYRGGLTPFGKGLGVANKHLSGTSGITKLIVFSDGRATDDGVITPNVERLLANNNITFYTVQIGDDEEGEQVLANLVQNTPGGIATHFEDVNSPASMTAFARQMFITTVGDEDGDGVCDDVDECPGTPAGAKVDARGCWTLSNVLFEYDKAVIKSAFRPLVEDVAIILKKNPKMQIRIEGHTCDIASDSYNQALSERRAKAIHDFLVSKGISADRLSARGYGESRPAYPNTSDSNREKNRRVEFTIVN